MVRTRVLTILLSSILVLASLYSVYMVPSVYALTDSGGAELRLLNVVNVTLTGDGPIYSIRFMNTALMLNNSRCPCCGGGSNSNSSELNSSYTAILNETDEGHTLIFTRIHIHGVINNAEINYTFYLLLYQSIHEEYNATILTAIFTDPANQSKFIFFKTVMNIQPIQDKAVQVVDAINIMNTTTLSEHYKVLAKTLEHLGKSEGITRRIWTKLGNELNKLSNQVKHQLKEYTAQKTYGTAIVLDGIIGCLLCTTACTLAITGGCVAGCAYFGLFCPYCIQILYYAQVLQLGCSVACQLAGCQGWWI